MAALTAHGYDVIPSETNFIMVGVGREVQPVIGEFREKACSFWTTPTIRVGDWGS